MEHSSEHAMARKKIGLKKVADGAAGVGTIQAIHEGDKYDNRPHDGMAVVTIRFGERKKQREKGEKSGPMISDYDNRSRTSEIPVPSDVAKKFSVGQKVRVSLTAA